MPHALRLHPTSLCESIAGIDVNCGLQATRLSLRYSIRGDIGALRVPVVAAPQRTDELWRHTCCEAFIGDLNREPYYEFNFAPSTAWAAYRFTGYRREMSAVNEIHEMNIAVSCAADRLVVEATVDLASLFGLSSNLRVALSTVIEDQAGRISYWALAHAPGKPDFHHADAFSKLANLLT
jgi:hypothetical protein